MEYSIRRQKAREEQKNFKLDLFSTSNNHQANSLSNNKFFNNSNHKNTLEKSNFGDDSSNLEISYVSDTSSYSVNNIKSPKSPRKRRSTLKSSLSSVIKPNKDVVSSR